MLFELWPTAKQDFETLIAATNTIFDDITPYPELSNSVHLSTEDGLFYATFIHEDDTDFYTECNATQTDVPANTVYVSYQTNDEVENGEPGVGMAIDFDKAYNNDFIVEF